MPLVDYGSANSSRSELLSEFLDHFDRICLQIVVRHFEDRSFRILVHGHDNFGVLHAGYVLMAPEIPKAM